ncbi:hypothetical protein IDH30_02615 [Pelagibacterales bacterium SAG-MED15]|nr:hypothetical protein [Pelagibacterales bacterium SAG-MED15]
MIRFLGFILIFLSIFISRAISIEVTSLEAEKRLEFSELFPKRICDNIYDKSTFGTEKKLKEDVTLKNFFNLKRINLDEQNSTLSLFLDQRSFYYTEPKLNLIIFNSLSDDFSDEMSAINKKVIEAKTQKIVVCEYDLNKSISEGKFFDFQMTYQDSTKVVSNIDPKILIFYDGTVEYIYYDEVVTYNTSDFNYKKYPFDEQSFKFVVYSKVFEKVSFRASNKFKILNDEMRKVNFTNISSPGWTINQFISYPYMETLVDAYSDYAKHSITTEFLIQRNSISFVFKFIMPIVMIIMITYLTIFLPFEFYRISVCITLVLSLVAFNLVAASSKIPDMPYLNVFDWFIFTAYINAISVLIVTFIESIYVGHFMGYGQKDILKVPKHEKAGLLIFRRISWIILLIILIVSALIGYFYIYK